MSKHLLVFSFFIISSAMACSGSVDGGGGDGGSQGQGGSGASGNAGSGGNTSSSGGNTSGSGGNTSGSGGNTSGSGGNTTASGGGINCTGQPPVFPMFDKTCTTAADCVTKFHMINCCGTLIAIGLHASESSAFDQAEAICQAMYPGCGCPAGPTQTEDGKTTFDTSTIQVDCLSGACSTWIP